MNVRKLVEAARDLNKSKNPTVAGRKLLVEGYRRMKESTDEQCHLHFELFRSMVIQRVYETGGDDWLTATSIPEELEDSERYRRTYLEKDGMNLFARKHLRSSSNDLNSARVLWDRKANVPGRFMGSLRRHIPGVGYAVSVRKSFGMNQDSFLICTNGGQRIYAVSDGCGSQRFASIASHASLQRIRDRSHEVVEKPVIIICEISNSIAKILNTYEAVAASGGKGLGTATLSLALRKKTEGKIYKLGDSFPFIRHNGGNVVERIGNEGSLVWVMGQQYPLTPENIEEYRRDSGQIILVTDGITNTIQGVRIILEDFFKNLRDNVIVAERLVRTALLRSIKTGFEDDMTVVIEEKTAA